VAASLWVLGRTILRRPLPPQFRTKTTYWRNQTGIYTAVLLPLAAIQSYSEVTFAPRVLEHERIAIVTPIRSGVRTGYFSPDDGTLLGGLAGWLISFQYVALQSLSSYGRRFARLGATSTGIFLGGILANEWTFRRLGEARIREHGNSVRATHAALWNLQHDASFMATLNLGEGVHLQSAIKQAAGNLRIIEARTKSWSPFKDPEKPENTSMALSWLDSGVYAAILYHASLAANPPSSGAAPDIDIMGNYFATIESPAERLDTMTKEACFIATRLQPQRVTLADRDPSARGRSDAYASLLTVQSNLILTSWPSNDKETQTILQRRFWLP
jgi:hypothetical protein